MSEVSKERRSQQDDEKGMIQGLQDGMPEAYSRFVEEFAPRIYRLCYGFVQDSMEAQDLTQEVLLRVLRNVGKFRGDSSLPTWVYRIAVNVSLDRLRRRQRHADLLGLDEYLPIFDEEGRHASQVVDWSDAPLDHLLSKEAKEVIAKAIAGLPPEFRVVLVMKDVEGIPLKEIGQILELSLPAVKSRLHRARLALRGVLSSYFLEKLGKRA